MAIDPIEASAGAESARGHRGAHPGDSSLFAEQNLPRLQIAVAELSWLLTRGYAMPSSLALVGDRHALTQRQRLALSRAACGDADLAARQERELAASALNGAAVAIDGFNLLITLEAALSGGVLLRCRDGCLRDMSSVHGSYRAVQETQRALELVGQVLTELSPRTVQWWLDQPVSNSGRLAGALRALAKERRWPWQVQLAFNPDGELARTESIVVSSDSAVLDRCGPWANLGRWIIEEKIASAWVFPMSDDESKRLPTSGQMAMSFSHECETSRRSAPAAE